MQQAAGGNHTTQAAVGYTLYTPRLCEGWRVCMEAQTCAIPTSWSITDVYTDEDVDYAFINEVTQINFAGGVGLDLRWGADAAKAVYSNQECDAAAAGGSNQVVNLGPDDSVGGTEATANMFWRREDRYKLCYRVKEGSYLQVGTELLDVSRLSSLGSVSARSSVAVWCSTGQCDGMTVDSWGGVEAAALRSIILAGIESAVADQPHGCDNGLTLEVHTPDGRHGDVCRNPAGGWSCPIGCQYTEGRRPPYCQWGETGIACHESTKPSSGRRDLGEDDSTTTDYSSTYLTDCTTMVAGETTHRAGAFHSSVSNTTVQLQNGVNVTSSGTFCPNVHPTGVTFFPKEDVQSCKGAEGAEGGCSTGVLVEYELTASSYTTEQSTMLGGAFLGARTAARYSSDEFVDAIEAASSPTSATSHAKVAIYDDSECQLLKGYTYLPTSGAGVCTQYHEQVSGGGWCKVMSTSESSGELKFYSNSQCSGGPLSASDQVPSGQRGTCSYNALANEYWKVESFQSRYSDYAMSIGLAYGSSSCASDLGPLVFSRPQTGCFYQPETGRFEKFLCMPNGVQIESFSDRECTERVGSDSRMSGVCRTETAASGQALSYIVSCPRGSVVTEPRLSCPVFPYETQSADVGSIGEAAWCPGM